MALIGQPTKHLTSQDRTFEFVLHEAQGSLQRLGDIVVGFHDCIFTGKKVCVGLKEFVRPVLT